MRYPLFIAALLSTITVQAGEQRLELEGKGIAGNQIRVAVYSANAPDFAEAAFEIGENAATKSIQLH